VTGTGQQRADPHAVEREAMVTRQIEARGVTDPRVLAAMRAVPRHLFVDARQRSLAYEDHPLPIGPGQTLSQPYIVAFMAEALGLRGFERVLEVGSGCGYFAAVLSLLVKDVCGIELDPALAEASRRLLERTGCDNVRIHAGDGAEGWPERAPFDAIVLSCAAAGLPPALWAQLAGDGVVVLPEARDWGPQQLVRLRRRDGAVTTEELLPVAFVPLRSPG
jgi:protein-L-isoaspartate(D-aspartate) O-methyltransferase